MAERLYDRVRRTWVSDQPEERVRQALLHRMIEDLGYPKSLLVVEKALKHMPHLYGVEGLPDRRADIVCFARRGEQLHPLLLVECKAEQLTQAVLQQVLGYNHYLQATCIAVANQHKLITGVPHPTEEGFHFQKDLPSFEELLALCSRA